MTLRVATYCTYDRIPRSSIKPRECFDFLPRSDLIAYISLIIPKQVRRYLAKIPLMDLRWLRPVKRTPSRQASQNLSLLPVRVRAYHYYIICSRYTLFFVPFGISGKVSCTVSVSVLYIYTCTSIDEELDGFKTSL
jgi:hypothetical protein